MFPISPNFAAFVFGYQVLDESDNATVPEPHKLMQESKNVLKAQIAFVVSILGPVHDAILVLQKEVGEILDITKMLDKCASCCNEM